MTLAATDSGLILIIIGGAIVLLPMIWLIATFNRLVRTRQHIKESWADIDVELKRRYDLIPNLVETAKGYASHERAAFERLAELRVRAMSSNGAANTQALDESALLLGLKQLFVVCEQYPTLKADAHFLSLQQELALTEDRIAAARRFYNANVREMNQLCQTVPTNLVAAIFGFKPECFFELSREAERVVPRIHAASMTQPMVIQEHPNTD
ncbi:MAG: LemA family protein [Phycisphaeraceae bacterium]|nr:LemA family protein [Phycisphaeraceae bacterium]